MEYDERLSVPLRWWVQGIMLVATFWLAVIVALPLAAAWTVTGAAGALVLAGLWAYGAQRLQVGDGVFRAGPARISVVHLGAAEALDAESTRRVAGRDADARAYLLLRPYLKRGVRVEITDPADPTPYWLVGTRRPDALVQALEAVSHEPADPRR
ncbi:DUF3093 domain-containing protein [Nocardioides bigeumensis]|uniref:DUF3093 domain-containing protein n=1 Tax=Nocardioides bigeumensis TaxID=433657 RepID=A0ABN2XUI7_9ACTN